MISETKKIEINLKRLITSCEKIITEDDKVNVANGDGEIKPIVIDNTFTVEKYIPIMLSLFIQLEEKYSEQIKQQQQLQQLQQQQQQSPFQLAKQVVSATTSPLSSNFLVSSFSSSTPSSPISTATTTTAAPTNEDSYQLTKEALNEYSRKIDVIVGLVNKGKLNSSAPISTKPSIIRLQASNLTHNKKMNEIHTVMKTRNKQEQKKMDLLIPGSNSSDNAEYRNINSNSNNTNNNNNLPKPYPSNPNNSTINNIKTTATTMNNSTSSSSPTVKYRNKFQSTNSQLKSLLGNRGSNYLHFEDEDDMDDDSFEKRTQEQRKLQENFTEELLGLSKNLKNHSSDMSRKLHEEDKKIDELNQLMDTSSSKIDRQNQNLKDYTARSTRDTLNYCLIIVLVLILFIITYIVIKFSNKS